MPALPRITELPPSHDRVAAASARALLVTERDTLRRAEAAASDATGVILSSLEGVREDDADTLKRRALGAMAAAAPLLRAYLSGAIASGRQDARGAARGRLQAELERAERDLRVEPFDAPPRDDASEDIGHAEAATDSYVSAWRGAVLAAVARSVATPDTPVAKDVRNAVAMQGYRLRRIASTENARAYNDEQAFASAWLAENYTPTGQRIVIPPALGPSRGPQAFGRALARDERLRRAFRQKQPQPAEARRERERDIPFLPDESVEDADDGLDLPAWAQPLVGRLMRRWEARNDGRTCSFCRSMNGALTLPGKPFPNGYEPGGPHPNCRCTGTIIVLTPKIIRMNERRAPQKGRAVLRFEKHLPREAVARARERELVPVRR